MFFSKPPIIVNYDLALELTLAREGILSSYSFFREKTDKNESFSPDEINLFGRRIMRYISIPRRNVDAEAREIALYLKAHGAVGIYRDSGEEVDIGYIVELLNQGKS